MNFKALLDKAALFLVIIGALNWGLVGALDFNLVTVAFGTIPVLVTALYVIIGLAAVYVVVTEFKS